MSKVRFMDRTDGEAKIMALLGLAVVLLLVVVVMQQVGRGQLIAAIGRGEKVVQPALTNHAGEVVKWRVVPAGKDE